MKLSVIIISYNVKHYIEQCIRSVWKSAKFANIECEIFVVDNNSRDNTINHLRSRFPQIEYPHLHLIANSRNVGFGRANNQAAQQAKGEYILFLNPDTLLTEHTLIDCITFADQQEKLGGIGVKMLKADGAFAFESRRGLPTPWTAFCKMSGLATAFPKSKFFGKYYMRYLDEDKTEEIEIISGAFLLAPKKTLDHCGLFDEDFFMYGEDIDLSHRMRLSGYHNFYIPTKILHYKGESTQKSSYKYVHVFYEAMLIFFKKHYNHYQTILSLPIKLAIFLRAIIALIGQQLDALSDFLALGKKKKEKKYLFIGSKENAKAIEQIAQQWQLDINYIYATEKELPNGHLQIEQDLKEQYYIIYDMDVYSNHTILNIFHKAPQQHSIGTYSGLSKTAITVAATYSL